MVARSIIASSFLAALGCAHGPDPRQNESKIAVARVQVRQISTACEQFHVDTAKYPERLNELVPKHLELIAKDPWGSDFVLEPGSCEVRSLGPDRMAGADDISSKGELPTAYTK